MLKGALLHVEKRMSKLTFAQRNTDTQLPLTHRVSTQCLGAAYTIITRLMPTAYSSGQALRIRSRIHPFACRVSTATLRLCFLNGSSRLLGGLLLLDGTATVVRRYSMATRWRARCEGADCGTRSAMCARPHGLPQLSSCG